MHCVDDKDDSGTDEDLIRVYIVYKYCHSLSINAAVTSF